MRLNFRTRRFPPAGPYAQKVKCPVCNRSGYGLEEPDERTAAPWQRDCLKGHPYACSCGKVFPNRQSIAAHVTANRQHGNMGHVREDFS